MNKLISRLDVQAGKVFFLMVVLLGAVLLAACDTSEQRTLGASSYEAPDETETATNTATVTTTVTVSTTATATRVVTTTATRTATAVLTTTVTPAGSVTASNRRVTICHRTGSDRNPYVQITVDENAVPAHRAHGDIIPAPAGGCPAAVTRTASPAGTSMPTRTLQATPTVEATRTAGATSTPQSTTTATKAKVTICHKTGSAKNPYVLITVDQSALPAHTEHGDVIPAPSAGCPAAAPQEQKPAQKPATKPAEKPAQKPATKPVQKPVQKQSEPSKPAPKSEPAKPEKPEKSQHKYF